MEQRRLRLGDILDDYCPRERRVTNHAVVAMIDETVKQTRCTTCDAEHVYKGGKAPRRKKPETTGALYKEVLAGMEEPVTAGVARDAADAEESAESEDMADPEIDDDSQEEDGQVNMLPADEGPVHRPLIRAQLPRPEGVKIERQAPEFTIRQNNGRGPSNFRSRNQNQGGAGNGAGNAGGQRFGRGPHRGGGRGPSQGFGRGPSGGGANQRPGGPRKRSR